MPAGELFRCTAVLYGWDVGNAPVGTTVVGALKGGAVVVWDLKSEIRSVVRDGWMAMWHIHCNVVLVRVVFV